MITSNACKARDCFASMNPSVPVLAHMCQLAYEEEAVWQQTKFESQYLFHYITDERTDTQAYVLLPFMGPTQNSPPVVVFRGTSSKQDVLTDLRIKKRSFGLRLGKVHAGFLEAYKSVRDKIKSLLHDFGSPYPPVCTGHSLGGALAMLAAFELHGRCVTFGAPRVGDGRFARTFRKRVPPAVRCTLLSDPVPHVPTCWRFRHTHGKLCLNKKHSRLSNALLCCSRMAKNPLAGHCLSAYAEAAQKRHEQLCQKRSAVSNAEKSEQ